MAIEFLAHPDEQIAWLKGVISRDGVWCWLRLLRDGSRLIDNASDIDNVDFNNERLLELDLGRHDLGQPVFETNAHRTDLDFPRSRAVQFDPSLILEDKMLTTGQLAITSKGWYEYYGVEQGPPTEWYHELSRSWKKTFRDEFMVVAVLDDGRKFESRYLHLTAGAIDWWKAGNELKDTTNMTFKYEVVPRTPRKPKAKQ